MWLHDLYKRFFSLLECGIILKIPFLPVWIVFLELFECLFFVFLELVHILLSFINVLSMKRRDEEERIEVTANFEGSINTFWTMANRPFLVRVFFSNLLINYIFSSFGDCHPTIFKILFSFNFFFWF